MIAEAILLGSIIAWLFFLLKKSPQKPNAKKKTPREINRKILSERRRQLRKIRKCPFCGNINTLKGYLWGMIKARSCKECNHWWTVERH
jgi:hypothetical protein